MAKIQDDEARAASIEANELDQVTQPLVGITTNTPGFEDGVMAAVHRKAGKLVGYDSTELSHVATYLAEDVIRARSKWMPTKGEWRPFANRTIKWSAMRYSDRVIKPAKAYRDHFPKSIDAPMDKEDEESESFTSVCTENAVTESRLLENNPERSELEDRVRIWVATLEGEEAELVKMFLDGVPVRVMAKHFGVDKSVIPRKLRALKSKVPATFRELYA